MQALASERKGMDKESAVNLGFAQPQRPRLVWVITLYELISAAWGLLSFVLVNFGVIPLTEAATAYHNSQTILDALFVTAIAVFNLAGTISLFFLKKNAFYLLLSSLILSAIATVHHIISRAWLGVMDSSGLIGAGIMWAIEIGIIIYVRQLIKLSLIHI